VHPALEECLAQIDQYFQGTRQEFSLQLAPEGTDFQQQVWRELSKIPYGQTASYLDIARAIGNEQAVRAVGAANGQNPISIIIPCHRVIGSDGKLTGYGGGLWRKEWLLTHERDFSIGRQLTFL
jgi:methylated-DNA-[protein]-cysteine S-methyltransferase